MKRPLGRPQPVLDRGDARTLALSTVHLDAARLRQLVVFERTLRGHAPPGSSAEQTAQAHAAAVAASGLAASEVEAPLALLRRFAANRSLSAALAKQLLRLDSQAQEDETTAKQAEGVRQRLEELAQALESREDAATRQLLEAHSQEILALFSWSGTD